MSDNIQQNSLHSLEENASLFADDTVTPCDFNITNQHSVTENVNDTNIACTPKQPSIHSQCNIYTETLLVNQTYSITILTIETRSHLQTSTQHYYNKNYKTNIGIYMTQ